MIQERGQSLSHAMACFGGEGGGGAAALAVISRKEAEQARKGIIVLRRRCSGRRTSCEVEGLLRYHYCQSVLRKICKQFPLYPKSQAHSMLKSTKREATLKRAFFLIKALASILVLRTPHKLLPKSYSFRGSFGPLLGCS